MERTGVDDPSLSSALVGRASGSEPPPTTERASLAICIGRSHFEGWGRVGESVRRPPRRVRSFLLTASGGADEGGKGGG